jgi:hypothetical protein
MGKVSLVFGVLSLIGTLIGFIPLLSFLTLLTIPLAGIGFIISIITIVTAKENKKIFIIGSIYNLTSVFMGIIRLVFFYPTF